MKIVVKFGGSSLASAEQFKKVADIIHADPHRRFVVPSAPGKRFDGDTKVTDMLYGCYDLAEAGKDFDMLVIPGAGHGYGSADKYFERKMYRFFAKHLLGDTRADCWEDINRSK